MVSEIGRADGGSSRPRLFWNAQAPQRGSPEDASNRSANSLRLRQIGSTRPPRRTPRGDIPCTPPPYIDATTDTGGSDNDCERNAKREEKKHGESGGPRNKSRETAVSAASRAGLRVTGRQRPLERLERSIKPGHSTDERQQYNSNTINTGPGSRHASRARHLSALTVRASTEP